MVDKRKDKNAVFNSILENFNFHETQKMMGLMEWHWYGEKTAPSTISMREMAHRLMTRVWDQAHSDMNGGFMKVHIGKT